MSEELKTVIVDVSTGIVIERELTAEEASERESVLSELKTLTEASQAARTSALAKLAALGLTEEEIAAL
jgi:hypothetical protein